MLLKTHVQVHLLSPLFAVGVWHFSVFRLKKTISIVLSCLFYGMTKQEHFGRLGHYVYFMNN